MTFTASVWIDAPVEAAFAFLERDDASAAMMLEWLGAQPGAAMIRRAVAAVFADRKARTRDLGGSLSTTEMGRAIESALA